MNYRQLKQTASSFTGSCFSSNVLLKSHVPSTGRTERSARPPVFRQTPLTVSGQLALILANVAPYILPLEGGGLTALPIKNIIMTDRVTHVCQDMSWVRLRSPITSFPPDVLQCAQCHGIAVVLDGRRGAARFRGSVAKNLFRTRLVPGHVVLVVASAMVAPRFRRLGDCGV